MIFGSGPRLLAKPWLRAKPGPVSDLPFYSSFAQKSPFFENFR